MPLPAAISPLSLKRLRQPERGDHLVRRLTLLAEIVGCIKEGMAMLLEKAQKISQSVCWKMALEL